MLIHRSKNGKPTTSTKSTPEVASTEQLRAWVDAIAKPRHFYYESNENRRVALWLVERFREWGYDAGFYGESRNVIATPRGISGRVTLVGAHYDSIPDCAGADDNASAVAAMLAAAQACAAAKEKPPVVFAAFNREEDGLLGSIEFVSETLPTLPYQVTAGHILEMVGFACHEPGSQRVPDGLPIRLPDTADFLGLLANGKSAALMKRIIAQARTLFPEWEVLGLEVLLGAERLLPVLRRSDHVPFWENRIPAVMWTDTAEFRNPNYHHPTDTPDTLDYDFLRQVTQLLTACLREK